MVRLSTGKKLGFLLLSFALVLLFVEVLLRVIRPELVIFANTWFNLYTHDQNMEWDLEPNQHVEFVIPTALEKETLRFHVATDGRGLRTSTHDPMVRDSRGEANTPRRIIHCIGDSYTMGWGVEFEESYPFVLGELLGASHEVVNVGMAGAGLLTSIERSRRLSSDLPPDVVIYLYNMTDYEDDERCATRRQENGGRSWPWLQPLCRSSYVCASPFAFLMWRNLSSVAADLKAGIPEKLSPPTMLAIEQLLDAASFDVPSDDHPLLTSLKEYARTCEENGIRFLLLVYDCDLVLAPRVVRVAREHEMESFVFFLGREYLLPDSHFNSRGNRRLAEMIRDRFFKDEPIERTPDDG